MYLPNKKGADVNQMYMYYTSDVSILRITTQKWRWANFIVIRLLRSSIAVQIKPYKCMTMRLTNRFLCVKENKSVHICVTQQLWKRLTI